MSELWGRAMRAGKLLLYVEDDPDDAELMRIALRDAGFPGRLVVIWNAERALDFLRARGEFAHRDKAEIPALIILDLKLPGMSGLELLQVLKADPLLRRVPAVMLSASNLERDRGAAKALGVELYAQKPVAFEAFVALVRRLARLPRPPAKTT